MATQIQLTRSGTPGAQPTATEMELGELALNYADGKLYFKNDSNNIEQLNSTYNNSGQTIYVNDIDDHVGLNTTSPEFLLDLGGSSAHTNNTLRLNQNDDGTAIRIGGSTAGDITLLRVDNADGETANSAEGFSIKYLGSNNHELGIFADNTSSEVQTLTILQNGNIGIGTIVPSVKLDVGGSVQVSGNLAISGNTVLGNATSDTTSISGGLTVDTDTLVVDESEDRVGINQPVPTEALDVEGNIVSSGTIDGAVITGTTLTDGTASISNGAITGATDITASGDITATGNVISADPTEDTHLTTKSYVDSQLTLGISDPTYTGNQALAARTTIRAGYAIQHQMAHYDVFKEYAGNTNGITPTYIDVLDIKMTPRDNNSCFKIDAMINFENNGSSENLVFRLYRKIGIGNFTQVGGSNDSNNSNSMKGMATAFYDRDAASTMNNVKLQFIDAPNTTSEVTYSIAFITNTSTIFALNRVLSSSNSAAYEYGSSNMIITELAGI
jgi:hypothetical protein